jgi:hypothetical protein
VRILFSGESYRVIFGVMIIILLLILFSFGRFLFRQWANYLSSREILFIDGEDLIVRRPVSIWGNTDTYGRKDISPLYVSEKFNALGFNYGSHRIYIAEGLSSEARQALGQFLNHSFFHGQVES